MFYGRLYRYYENIFKVKIQLFVTAKSDQDLDPDPDSHWLAPWIRIRIWIRLDKKLDPDPH
jgi:hypothetical protein